MTARVPITSRSSRFGPVYPGLNIGALTTWPSDIALVERVLGQAELVEALDPPGYILGKLAGNGSRTSGGFFAGGA